MNVKMANARMLLSSTCQPMAMYFSRDFLRRKFQSAWKDADKTSRKMAKVGMLAANLPRNHIPDVINLTQVATLAVIEGGSQDKQSHLEFKATSRDSVNMFWQQSFNQTARGFNNLAVIG